MGSTNNSQVAAVHKLIVRMLLLSSLYYAPMAAADVAIGPSAAFGWGAASSELVLVGKCKSPPRPTEGCIKDPCTGNVICCTRTSGSTNCQTMTPKKKN